MNDIWPLIKKVGKAVGEKRNNQGNEEARRKPKLEKLEVGQLVLRKIVAKKDKLKRKWEGLFEVVEYDKERRGYKLKEVLGGGRVLKGWCPIEQLKVCTDAWTHFRRRRRMVCDMRLIS